MTDNELINRLDFINENQFSIMKRFLLFKIIISSCVVLVVISVFLFVNEQNKAERLVFQAIQKEREALRIEREAIRAELWHLGRIKNEKSGKK